MKYISKAIEKDPTNGALYHQRGAILFKYQKYDKVYSDFIVAKRLQPDLLNDEDFLNNSGIILQKFNRHADAIAEFKRSLAINENGIRQYCYLTESYVHLEQYQDASEISRILQAKLPGEYHFHFVEAFCAFSEEKWQEAILLFNTTIEHNYSLGESLFFQSICKINMGNAIDVIVDISDLTQREKENWPMLLLPLAKAHLSIGNESAANNVKEELKNLNILNDEPGQILLLPVTPGDIEIRRFETTRFPIGWSVPASFFFN